MKYELLHKLYQDFPDFPLAQVGPDTLYFLPPKHLPRASLVVQWLRIRLPMQGTQVQALAREDPSCHGATKPVSHNYWVCTLEPASHNY